MDCKDCQKSALDEQIKLIGSEIKRRINCGTEGQAEEIMMLAQAQLTMIETRRMF